MARFCTKCGAPQAEGMRFCTGCGADLGEPSTPPSQPPAAQAPPSSPPLAASPAAAARPAPAAQATPAVSPASPLLKIVLAVLAVVVFLSLLSVGAHVFMVYRARQKVRQLQEQVPVTSPMPTGTTEAPTQPTATTPAPSQEAAPVIDLGVAVYPNATTTGGGTEIGKIKSQQYVTDDSVDKVVSFYKDKLGSKAMVTQSEGSALVQVVGSNGLINITIAPDKSSGKTRFSVTSIQK